MTRTLTTRWLLPLAGCTLLLSAEALAERPYRVERSGFGIQVAAGDWQLAAELTAGTDSSNDTVNQKERARTEEYNRAEARRRGETADCIIVEQVRTLRARRTAPADPGFAVAEQVRQQLIPTLSL